MSRTRRCATWRRGGLALVLGAVAGLGACKTNKKTPPVAHDLVADSADQVMYGVKFFMTADGVNRARIEGDTAYFFDDNTRVRMLHVTSVFYTKTGEENATLKSKRGTYFSPTESMTANGDVQVVSVDGRVLRTEELKYDKNRNEISSDSAFVLTEPDRRLEGVGFRSDPNLQNVRVLRVESGTAGNVSVPQK